MSKVLAIANAVIRDAVRRKVVWVVVLFAVLLSFVAPSLPSYGVGVVSAVYREVAIALMFTASLIVTLALSATRVPIETERRTVFNVLSRDVRRSDYLAGTWLGLIAVVGVAVIAFTLVAVIVGGAVYREVMWRLFLGAFAVWLEMGVISAVTVALSTRFGAVTNVAGALAFTFIGHSVSALVSAEGPAPWYIPSLDVFDVINAVAHGEGYNALHAVAMLGAFAAMSGLLLVAAAVSFGGRDL